MRIQEGITIIILNVAMALSICILVFALVSTASAVPIPLSDFPTDRETAIEVESTLTTNARYFLWLFSSEAAGDIDLENLTIDLIPDGFILEGPLVDEPGDTVPSLVEILFNAFVPRKRGFPPAETLPAVLILENESLDNEQTEPTLTGFTSHIFSVRIEHAFFAEEADAAGVKSTTARVVFIPEPSTFSLLGLALLGSLGIARSRRAWTPSVS